MTETKNENCQTASERFLNGLNKEKRARIEEVAKKASAQMESERREKISLEVIKVMTEEHDDTIRMLIDLLNIMTLRIDDIQETIATGEKK